MLPSLFLSIIYPLIETASFRTGFWGFWVATADIRINVGPQPVAPQPLLPAGWCEVLTDEGRPYYFQRGTQDVQWHRPSIPAVTVQRMVFSDCYLINHDALEIS